MGTTTDLQLLIVKIARSFIGQTEIIPNAGFHDPVFEKLIRSTGWTPPEPWCAAFAKAVMETAFKQLDPLSIDLIIKYYSLSAVTTYNNAKASKELHVTQVPDIGYTIIFQEGHTALGHAGIVTAITPTGFTSVEGNTTDPAHPIQGMNPREGYIVAEKPHILNKPFDPNGLNVLGFISPNKLT